jgi:Holliday junction resolvasome RuvABC ATP-dependent DNA helicase subunit
MQKTERFLDANIPDEFVGSIRPRTLGDFIGHESLKQNLLKYGKMLR